MQVLSSRLNSSVRSNSTSRTNKKGLSLTSRTKCNSLPKPSSQFLSEQFFQSDLHINKQTQLSLKFNVAQQTFGKSQALLHLEHRGQMEKSIKNMPKITFHYTSQSVKNTSNIQRINNFTVQNTNKQIPIQSNRSRFFPSKDFENIRVIRSIQSKNLSRNKLCSSNISQESNAKSTLIDSRVIDREITHQDVYQNIPKTKQFSSQISVKPFKDEISFNSIKSQLHYEKSCQRIPQISYLAQQQSPFHLLLSTANKHQSKQLSPSIEKQIQKVNISQTSSFKRIPQIQQFKVNEIVIEENLQQSASNSRIFNQTTFQKQPEENNTKSTLSSALQPTFGSIQAENDDGVLMLHSNNNILQNKQVNVYQIKIKLSPEKINLVQIKQVNYNKQKQVDSVLSNIENKPPEGRHITTISGRRNMKKFREIEKRLGEIINICNNNL